MGLALPKQPAFLVKENLEELAELARSTGISVVGRSLQTRQAPDGRTLIGRGKVEEIARAANELNADIVIFDDNLTPYQVKNLEHVLGCAVIDRSTLLLELFVRRARTREARTQVELTHLSRQVGGIGVRGGEGETQLEVDRRMLRTRIKQLQQELAKIKKRRELHRRSRRGTPIIALAGYTNAGKSTLFNCFTKADVTAEDKLFATLDSRLRKGPLEGMTTAIFVDTVGFIRKLPHHLVDSFRSTLEEITHADLVLHVIDRSHQQWCDQMDVGKKVLADLGVDPCNVLTVFNKTDRCSDAEIGVVTDGIAISAATGDGIDILKARLLDRIAGYSHRRPSV